MCACNARFSVHILTRPSETSNLGSCFEQQARQGLSISDLRLCCFLIEHAINSGSGGRAWSDIAMTEALVQLNSAGQALDSDAEALAVVSQYLAVARAIMCIGNPDLHLTQQRAPQHSLSSATSDTPVWRRLWIILRIQELCRKPFTQQETRPWDKDSDFRCIQEELDGFMTRWPGPFSTAVSDACPKDPETSIALLVSHCSIISPNRTFLPIPRKTTGCREGAHVLHWVNFPSAPDLFIRERISRCEASVAAICLVCRELIADGQFFAQSFWIGLSCVLSALVMISPLHAGSMSGTNMVESLKFTFTIVVSLRQFLKPANDWVEMLFHLYDAAAYLDPEGCPAENSFLTYFDRYPGIQDKIKVPLSWKPSPTPSPRQKRTPRDYARSEAPMREREAPCREATWIQIYTDQLDLDMALPDQLEAANTSTGSALGWPVPNDGFSVDVSEMLTLILNDNLEHPRASAANEVRRSRVAPRIADPLIINGKASPHPRAQVRVPNRIESIAEGERNAARHSHHLEAKRPRGLLDLPEASRRMRWRPATYGVRCRGFGAQTRLPDDTASRPRARRSTRRPSKPGALPGACSSPVLLAGTHSQSPSAWMPWPSLNGKDSFFMQHFLRKSLLLYLTWPLSNKMAKNISRIPLAVDYDGNGYRQLLPLAMEEPALVNGILAVASSHHHRWQGVQDTESRAYLRASTAALSRRFRQPQLIDTPNTLATILNFGQPGIPRLESWLDTSPGLDEAGDTIDVLFGCSTNLPRLMLAASELESLRSTGKLSQQEALASAEALQTKIRQTQIPEGSEPSLGVIYQ
ncbi:uncharacterized protein NECHADRAFT_88893 [Fusarium vanettenii 77-13-4]|uniref:Transcription factor domain-containing protein n=1 Tax=Fusarium vanettenii (strain ATCC MYA-4622 / CBS 123669 / FGSC 9596 / NRRL 45880 / 77-13-4) TaxID=660122 RepID=C7Z3F1_FUSV7|nr:uncharacterized protein NECHADRAFT_88893 [Fusarium vanettenii 77-13-4]EEU41457.1 predicted protein [Fusarium vanettenii 77-13-4]